MPPPPLPPRRQREDGRGREQAGHRGPSVAAAIGLSIAGVLALVTAFGITALMLMPPASRPHAKEPPKKTTPKPTPEVKPESEKPFDWAAATDKASLGDLNIELLWAGRCSFRGSRFGAISNGIATVLKLRFTNTSKARKFEFSGWPERRLEDEHGNKYDQWVFPDGFGFDYPPGPDGEDMLDVLNSGGTTVVSMDILPEASVARIMVFDELVKPAGEVRLTVSERDGKNTIRLKTKRHPKDHR